ncbi:guanine nucleotide exchange factor DBS isoform X6 [Chironomus tepperi]|uniref:guanine nucleotide exchange factor DBS isoform X6 n=1 Tax=Chironomus tepperi TaxID=113505 RepID=UPI00391FB9B6
MESGLEKQINEFLEKFSNHSVEDDFLYNTGLIRARSNNMDDYDALEMTEKYVDFSDTSQSENRHSYQQQMSVNSATSVQTVIFNNSSLTGNDLMAQMNASESLSSILTRSSNGSSHKQKTLSVSSAEEPLHISDVADLLHQQYAIITGGRSMEGSPIITFPDHNSFHLLNDRDYQRLIQYLVGVTSLQDADLGFHLIIDRRKQSWASVKSVLARISTYFPGIVQCVYVIRPSGFLQKAISEVSSKFFKDEFRFKMIICAQIDELHHFIHKSQLTMDLAGDLFYSHHEWIQQRISLENFSAQTTLVAHHLEIFMRTIHDTEFPNSVESTEALLVEQGVEYTKLKDEIQQVGQKGEELLAEIRRKAELCVDRVGNISSIERLIVQLQETEMRFDHFYEEHTKELRNCLELRRFEQDFRELQTKFDSYLKIMNEMTEIGDTVVRIDQLIQETQSFRQSCDEDVVRATSVIENGRSIIENNDKSSSKDTVEPKCNELNRMLEMFNEKVSKRVETLTNAHRLMERVEKANEWCAKGIDLLASQRIENMSLSSDIAEQKLQDILAFVESAKDFELSSLKDLKSCQEENTTSLETIILSQVLQRIDDVTLMCDKRIATLKKLASKPARPVQSVQPEPAVPLQPNSGAPNLLRSRKHSGQRVDNYITRPLSCEGPSDSGVSVSSENIFSPDGDNTSLTAQSQTDYESRKVKQKHVLTELLETERIYVNEMRSILTGYKDKLLSEEMQSMVPAGLQGNADILFGNLQEIYTFHSDVFLKDLENSICLTELVALCFVQRRDVFFRLYSYYCQNIPRSERLRETLVDTHLFLSECQKKLGHKLPLAAYLLKPVQRITKYQLLLKDLLKFSDSGTCTKELQKALDCMLVVLKCVNDSMHQIAITGFPADLSQQGDLLLQDSFQICSENKKDIKLRIKPQQRHVFLYQKAILFCKQDTKTGHNKSTYQFKHWLKMSQIGLTESVRGDVKKFEVWLQGRSEVHTFQAATIEIKGKWVSEIKRVLMNQLEELKDEKIKQYGNHVNHRPLKQPNSISFDASSTNINQRAMSVESTNENATKRNITPPMMAADDANNTWNSTGISASSSEHDNHETNAWSSDCSNSEDDNTFLEENAVPGTKFIALADYNAMGNSEVSLKEGATVELRKLGCAGWVFVKKLDDETEGWVPCAFLQSTGSMESSIKKSSKHKHRT